MPENPLRFVSSPECPACGRCGALALPAATRRSRMAFRSNSRIRSRPETKSRVALLDAGVGAVDEEAAARAASLALAALEPLPAVRTRPQILVGAVARPRILRVLVHHRP